MSIPFKTSEVDLVLPEYTKRLKNEHVMHQDKYISRYSSYSSSSNTGGPSGFLEPSSVS